jgi:hypothetical protein
MTGVVGKTKVSVQFIAQERVETTSRKKDFVTGASWAEMKGAGESTSCGTNGPQKPFVSNFP